MVQFPDLRNKSNNVNLTLFNNEHGYPGACVVISVGSNKKGKNNQEFINNFMSITIFKNLLQILIK